MKVKDLIQRLKNCDKEADVRACGYTITNIVGNYAEGHVSLYGIREQRVEADTFDLTELNITKKGV